MDNFREWLSDNLRYILLGLAIILVLVVAIFAAKLINGIVGEDSPAQETQSEPTVIVETDSEPVKETESANELVENDQKILETVQAYYTARSNQDMDTLSTLVENLTEEDKQSILNTAIESYNNIKTYSKDGPTEGTYVVYTYYEAKVSGVDSLAPGLACLYVCSREDGTLYIGDKEKDTAIKDYIAELNGGEDVKALVESVDEKYNQVLQQDENLQKLLAEEGTPETEVVLPNSSEVDVQTNKIVKAVEVCNVRADSREDSEIIGMLSEGETVTRVQQLENGWSEIRYMDNTGYVRSDLLTEETAGETESVQ